MTLFQELTSGNTLLAIGVSLCVVGVFLRGFAKDSLRTRAFRHQHQLHHRKPGTPDPPEARLPEPGWFDRHLPAITRAVIGSGALITLVSFFRH